MDRSERIAFAALGCLSVAACNAIAGLGQFQEVPCEPCVDGASPAQDEAGNTQEDSGPPTPPVDAGEDAGTDALADTGNGMLDSALPDAASDSTVSVDRRWARWIMPNGDNASGDDGGTTADGGEGGLPNQASYNAATEGIVTDRITTLVWTQATQSAATLAAATATCAAPWRVPTRIELVTILDTSRAPAVNPVFDVGAETLWTSSVTPDGRWWTIDFGTGIVVPSIASAVLCVQGGP